MPAISRSDSIAANSRSGNLIDGEAFEVIAQPSRVRVSLSAAAAGLTVDLQIGGVSLLQGATPPATNRFPVRPDDSMLEIGALPGEKIDLRATNTTAGAITLNTLIDIDPL